MKHVLAASLATFAVCLSGLAQGFVNLNFESTTLPNNGAPNTVSTTNALPGWSVSVGNTAQSTILYNNATLGNSSAAIWGNYNGPGYSFNALQGNFSVLLAAGADPNNQTQPANVSISQTGLVPVGTSSILFIGTFFSLPNLSVTLNGQDINIQPISTTTNYTLYGGDVSAFAGQTANLTFTAISHWPGSGLMSAELDDIQFSPAPVPEPGVLSLAVTAGLLFWQHQQRKTLRS